MTDDEIVMVLRCAADIANVERLGDGCVLQAAVNLGVRLDDSFAVSAMNRRVQEVGMWSLFRPMQSWKTKRDALLEAAARIEEGR